MRLMIQALPLPKSDQRPGIARIFLSLGKKPPVSPFGGGNQKEKFHRHMVLSVAYVCVCVCVLRVCVAVRLVLRWMTTRTVPYYTALCLGKTGSQQCRHNNLPSVHR